MRHGLRNMPERLWPPSDIHAGDGALARLGDEEACGMD